jgi:nucleoside-diphosphate-sugar epimerase
VLITGGAGFTGRRLARRLRQDGHDVAALSRHAADAGTVVADLCDVDAATRVLSRLRPRAIIHLAGVAAPSHNDIAEMYAANVIGTANLFSAITAAKAEPDIVIVASSGQIYAPAKDATPLAEDARLAPSSHYAVSKHATEEIAALYVRRFRIIVTRAFNYTGPGQDASFLVPKIVRHYVERRGEIRLGNLDLYRDISDVERAVEAFARLVSRAIAPTVVNVSSGRAVHLAEILTIMEEISLHRLRIVTDPAFLRADEPRYIIGSPVRLEGLVGPLPNPEFRDTLARMYDAMCEQTKGVAPP